MIGTDRSVGVGRRAAAQVAVSIETDDRRRYSNFAEHPLHNRIGHDRADRSERNRALLFVLAQSYIPFTGSGFMLRKGGEISNFTTGITPRYWAWTMGCEHLPDRARRRSRLRKQDKCDCRKAQQNGQLLHGV